MLRNIRIAGRGLIKQKLYSASNTGCLAYATQEWPANFVYHISIPVWAWGQQWRCSLPAVL
jgi:hypothetical protein